MRLLNGAHVLVTRPAHQAENLSRLIEERRGVAVRFPTLAIVAMEDSRAIQKTLAHLDRYQWLVFISANAVTMHSYYSDGVKMDKFKPGRIAAIGKATAQALVLARLPVDLVPESGYNSEALLAMPEMQQMKGQRCLIVRGEGGREELAATLRSRGACVEYLDLYRRIIPGSDSAQVSFLLAQDKLDVITITSGEALRNLLTMLEKYHQRLLELPLVVISNRIRQIAEDMGFKR
ncbi:MAG TPA: uroporphyrinogen-III synthase, partial [Methylococcales bacterium]